MKKIALKIALIVLVVFGGGWYLATEADAAEPGDFLYPVDLATESIVRTFTFDDVALAELEEEILDERVDELESLTDEEEIDEELVAGATDRITDQQSRVQTRLETEDGELSGELEQVRSRYEVQAEEHIQIMEKVQTQVQGEDTQLKVKEAVSAYEKSLSGNTDSGSGSDNGNGNGK